MTIFVHKDAFEEKEQKILAGIHKAVNPDHIELESDLALIAIVGRGMKSHERYSRKDLLCTGTCPYQRQDD